MIRFTPRFWLMAILLAPIGEIVTFALIAQSFGFWRALAGLILLSVVGISLLRAQGLSFITEMSAGSIDLAHDSRIADRLLAGLGGILLALPGYLTAIAGLALLAKPMRLRLAAAARRRFTPTPASAPTGTVTPKSTPIVELGEDEFRHQD